MLETRGEDVNELMEMDVAHEMNEGGDEFALKMHRHLLVRATLCIEHRSRLEDGQAKKAPPLQYNEKWLKATNRKNTHMDKCNTCGLGYSDPDIAPAGHCSTI